jgi:hypothetical protein
MDNYYCSPCRAGFEILKPPVGCASCISAKKPYNNAQGSNNVKAFIIYAGPLAGACLDKGATENRWAIIL